MSPGDIFSKLTSKGDIAAACLGFAAGFVVDAFLFPVGVPPGTTAGVFAVGAVGIKNSVTAALDKRGAARRESQKSEQMLTRARRFVDFLSCEPKESAAFAGAVPLSRDIKLWKLGVLSDEQLERAMQEHANRLRKSGAPTQFDHLSPVPLQRFAGLAEDTA